MKTIIVEKKRLVVALNENRETHKKEFHEAMAGYEDAQEAAIRKIVEEASDGRKNRKALHAAYGEFNCLVRPRDHSSSYDQALALMEWEIRTEVELSVNDVECYIRDNWDWQESFKRSHSSYTN